MLAFLVQQKIVTIMKNATTQLYHLIKNRARNVSLLFSKTSPSRPLEGAILNRIISSNDRVFSKDTTMEQTLSPL
jgi:hypothetical protein